jgi:uncharacterized membrane protein YcfT
LRPKNVYRGLLGIEPSGDRKWRWLLWLVPGVSIMDVLWAISAKAGLGLTFGLGLNKFEMVHVIIQVSLVVVLSLCFVVLSPNGEDVTVVEVLHAGGLEEQQRNG